jgi:hypothetical protein
VRGVGLFILGLGIVSLISTVVIAAASGLLVMAVTLGIACLLQHPTGEGHPTSDNDLAPGGVTTRSRPPGVSPRTKVVGPLSPGGFGVIVMIWKRRSCPLCWRPRRSRRCQSSPWVALAG